MVSRIFLIAMSLFYISPMYWMLVTALKSDQELSRFPPTLWPSNLVGKTFIRQPRPSRFSPILVTP